MSDRKAPTEQSETPEDVATLYTWANLHGAKYREFSASRAQSRDKARQRVQDAIDADRRRAREEADAARQAEWATQRAAQNTAHESLRQAVWQQPQYEQLTAPPVTGPAHSPAPQPDQSYPQPRLPWVASEPQEEVELPAWLTPARVQVPGLPAPPDPAPQAPEDTLQGSRDRIASRWFALQGVYEGVQAPVEPVQPPAPSRAEVMAVFSLAGGVGKTSLVATLGCALAGRGERVLLVDTAVIGLLPFYFGARDRRPGVLRTFSPQGPVPDSSIQMVAIDPETLAPETLGQDHFAAEISRFSRGVTRVIFDVATASSATTRRVMRMDPLVLVPLVPDMNSVLSVTSIDAFFQQSGSDPGKQVHPYYVLNQFDPSLPLHLDVREVLRQQLGDRLLPFALHRAPAVSEALAEGMTVMDYAPGSNVAEDFTSLAEWVKGLSAPPSTSERRMRWSER
ncbi:MAG: cellulose synthase operon protein YhjQ/BcsQ [Terracidiphilus sp.]|jgi:cellulose synthase operon protein YhjQ